MNPATLHLYLAAEDLPGLAVGRKLVEEHRPRLEVNREENGGGFGTLRRKTPNFDQMASRGYPVLLLTDLDADPCPSSKIAAWLGRTPNPRFLLRICVREIEAWLLADQAAIAGFLGIQPRLVPQNPEALLNPKAKLIDLAQRAPRRIRAGLTPSGRASIGPEYNELLVGFVATHWSIARAAERAPSLQSARRRLAEMAMPPPPRISSR